MKKHLNNTRGEGDYITTTILVVVVVMMIALVINVFSLVVAKQKMDACANQMVRQIQLAGEVNADTQTMFDTITADIYGITTPSYTVNTTYLTDSKIQLGTGFTVTITARITLGDFGDVLAIPLTVTSTSAGVSEVYHKP